MVAYAPPLLLHPVLPRLTVLGGRILAVADAYDALRTRRYYKPAYPIADALRILRDEASASRLDGGVVSALERCLDEVERTITPLRPPHHSPAASLAA